MSHIYFDNAAGTRIDPRVLRAMIPALQMQGNPSAFNESGREAREVLEQARADVARFLHAHPSEIVWCASGSEANTLAIEGVARALGKPRSALTTPIEHQSVLESFNVVRQQGWTISFLPISGEGVVSQDALSGMLTPDVAIISVMYANNEIGSIQPIRAMSRTIRQWRKEHRTHLPLFHVDACQATGFLPMNVQDLGVDLLTINAAKVHGPRGVAALFVRRGIEIQSIVQGGDQEFGRRAGTENVAGAVGFAKAVMLIDAADGPRVSTLRDTLIRELAGVLPDARLNGPQNDQRLPNNVHISIPGVSSEELLLALDAEGISAGSGSACTAHRVEPSHVLKAIGVSRKYLDGALRISLSRTTKKRDIIKLVQVLPGIVQKIRRRKLK